MLRLPTKTVYLAGPISHLSHEAATYGWRKDFAEAMPSHIHCISPMRSTNDRAHIKKLPKQPPADVLKRVVTRDFFDIQTCDLIVANFLDADIVSIGTCCEFGFACALRKPVIMVHKKGDVHDHGFLTHIAGWVVKDLNKAIDLTINTLTPGY